MSEKKSYQVWTISDEFWEKINGVSLLPTRVNHVSFYFAKLILPYSKRLLKGV